MPVCAKSKGYLGGVCGTLNVRESRKEKRVKTREVEVYACE
jgi:hypothetical protein